MKNPEISKLLGQTMTRKQFLMYCLLVLATVAGITAVIRHLKISAATAVSSALEPENGTLSGGAKIVADGSASGGNAVMFGQTPTTTVPARGPVRYADIATARANLRAPSDANYVMWNPSWPVDRDLEDVFASLAANDILVLPERAQPYMVDSSEGFRAASVASVTGRNGQVPIINRYKNIRGARTWFAMARAQRGIIGLGPNAVIEMSNSSWTQGRQIEDKGSIQDDGWVSPGRFWTNTSGVLQKELVGCQEKFIEAAHPSSYFGNFTMRTRDLGGVAYNGLTGGKVSPIYERLNVSGGWRGFSGIPNGEAGGIATGGSNYLVSKCIIGTRDTAGNRVGTSPIMINNSTGGRIEDIEASETLAGMMTIWSSSGKHTLSNVTTKFNYGPGLNLEKLLPGFELEWIGGTNWSDYYGRGGKTPKPADQGDRGRLHLGFSPDSESIKITLRDVDFDTGPTPGAVNIQYYGKVTQKLSDVKRFDAAGNALPVKIYGSANLLVP